MVGAALPSPAEPPRKGRLALAVSRCSCANTGLIVTLPQVSSCRSAHVSGRRKPSSAQIWVDEGAGTEYPRCRASNDVSAARAVVAAAVSLTLFAVRVSILAGVSEFRAHAAGAAVVASAVVVIPPVPAAIIDPNTARPDGNPLREARTVDHQQRPNSCCGQQNLPHVALPCLVPGSRKGSASERFRAWA